MKKDTQRAKDRRIERKASIDFARDILKYPNEHLLIDNAREIAEVGATLECDERGFLTTKGYRQLFSGAPTSFPKARADHIAKWLLQMACIRPQVLRIFAEAICTARDNNSVSLTITRSIALEFVNAYEQCTAFYPSITEVREVFIARKEEGLHNEKWPGNSSASRTLRNLGLKLQAKRGRPRKRRKK